MTKPKLDLRVYLVTDSSLIPASSSSGSDGADDDDAAFDRVLHAALAGGTTLVQLREKTLDTAPFIARARRAVAVAHSHNALLLINDRVDVCLAAAADGVHVGQSDMSVAEARAILGPHKVVGATVNNLREAVVAAEQGADYIGTSAVFPTKTKKHPEGFVPMGTAGVRALLQQASVHPLLRHLPFVTIGGLNAGNVPRVLAETRTEEKQLAGVAVVSAIMAASDPEQASRELRKIVDDATAVPTSPQDQAAAAALRDAIRAGFAKLKSAQRPPLVHHITNFVVMTDNANATLHLGGLPVMAHAEQEVGDMTALAQALVINVGTLSEAWVDAMLCAGKAANARGVPVVLDPVGAGATPYRLAVCRKLLDQVRFAVIKGNAGEVAALAGVAGVEVRGVESGEMEGGDAARGKLAKALAAQTKAVVAVTGAVDMVSDGTQTWSVHNGNAWLGKITGTGCTTASLIGCFAGVMAGQMLEATVAGIAAMGVAAEMAEEHTRGPASFKVALFDALYGMDAQRLSTQLVIRRVE
ncbi:thiamine biosynthetic bifunctional enzyme [Sorochytrium milnesiophthora]